MTKITEKTLYCKKCGKPFEFIKKSKDYYEPFDCKSCGAHMEILTCEKCGHSFVFSGVRKAPTVFIYCEKCEYCIEATSDYGFGPTIPAQIFKGSRLLAVVKGARTFYDADNNKLDIKLPPQSRKESLYTRIFSICSDVADYLMEKEKTEKNE